ncbi:tyrosine--tRNA ligase, partial [Candidatus Bipolaricaulota bacterium]|nr:tyrosine--tRNA ligase [Candidatus Bipolaricaulota bacterium]
YFLYLTDVDLGEVDALIEESPRDAKRMLAREIVTMYHDGSAAKAAEAEFDRIHVRHERPSDVPQVSLDRALVKDDGTVWVIDLLQGSGLVGSRSEAKRLIEQGGVRVNESKVESADVDLPFAAPMLVQVGKRAFVELT